MVAMRLGVDQIADRRLFLELLAPAHRIDRLLRRIDHDITVTRLDKARIAAGEIDFGEAVGPDPAHRKPPIPVSLQATRKMRCELRQAKARSRFPVSSASCSTSSAAFVCLASAADCPDVKAVQSCCPVLPSGRVRLCCAGTGSGVRPDSIRSSMSLLRMYRQARPLMTSVTTVDASLASANAARCAS